MDVNTAVSVFRDAVLQTLILVGPILVIAAAAGLLLSVFQATTSLQDQTLTFVPKIAAIFAALAYFFPWMLRLLVNYTETLFKGLADLAK